MGGKLSRTKGAERHYKVSPHREVGVMESQRPKARSADTNRAYWYAGIAKCIAEKAHKHLQELTGKKTDFPKTYNEETRVELKKAFEEEVAKLAKKAKKKKR